MQGFKTRFPSPIADIDVFDQKSIASYQFVVKAFPSGVCVCVCVCVCVFFPKAMIHKSYCSSLGGFSVSAAGPVQGGVAGGGEACLVFCPDLGSDCRLPHDVQ